MTLDHAIPRSEGGTNDPNNLLTACLDCNTQKGARTVLDFVTTLWEMRDQEIYLGILRQLKAPINRKRAKEMLQRRRLTTVPGACHA